MTTEAKNDARTPEQVVEDIRSVIKTEAGVRFVIDLLEDFGMGKHLDATVEQVERYNLGVSLMQKIYDANDIVGAHIANTIFKPKEVSYGRADNATIYYDTSDYTSAYTTGDASSSDAADGFYAVRKSST